MKSFIKISILALVLVSFASCNNKSRPNYEFMPNMYESVAYETYQESDAFNNGVQAQLPVDGTIPRGYTPFDIDNTTQGYNDAKANLKNMLDSTQVNQARGKELYNIYCGICHGSKGDGKGKLVQREKILGIPSFDDLGRAISEGSVYHTIYYGKNAMGSYAAQLNHEERWQVVSYVMKLKEDLEK